MIISELIEVLHRFQQQHGDLEIITSSGDGKFKRKILAVASEGPAHARCVLVAECLEKKHE
jgi:hypothetical protein